MRREVVSARIIQESMARIIHNCRIILIFTKIRVVGGEMTVSDAVNCRLILPIRARNQSFVTNVYFYVLVCRNYF